MQSSSLNAQGSNPLQPPPGPHVQTVVPLPSILVQSSPPPSLHGTPQFPIPQIPPSATQSMVAIGTQVTGTPAFPMPQRHATVPVQPTTPPSLHPLRTIQSAPGISSRTSFFAPAVESLRGALYYPEGEIPVLEKDDRVWATLAHSGPLATQKRRHLPWYNLCGSKISWVDASGVLLDNQFLLLGRETEGSTKLSHTIRPIPLECLRLASFNDEPEVRQVQQSKPGFFRRNLCCFTSSLPEPLYPFTLYHSAAKITRRHTLYAQTATERNKWRTALDEAIEARKSQVSQQEKTLYATQTLNDGGFFRIAPRIQFTRGVHYTGRTVCAAGFTFQGEGYIAVGCTTGVYVSKRATEYSFRRVLEYNEPMSIVAIPEYNKFIVHCEMSLYSYPLEMVAGASRGEVTTKELDESISRKPSPEEHGTVLFLKTGSVAGRTLVIYAATLSGQTSVYIRELSHEVPIQSNPAEYKLLSSVPIPEAPHDAVFFLDKVAICAPKAIYILEPLLDNPSFKVAPDLPNTKRDPKTLQFVLKTKGDTPKILDLMGNANILGMVTYDTDILLIYEDFGCFVNHAGKPARTNFYTEWERRATAYARRGSHLLLLSSVYIEVRNIDTGKLVQIVDVNDMRLLRSSLTEPAMLVAAMIGGTEDDGGRTERLAELISR